MLSHYFKIAIRNILKHKSITLINILGLAVGMACAILIFLWVGEQLSYDQWQVNKDRIYRLESESWVVMPPYLRETAAAFPEVQEAVRFFFWSEPTLKYNETCFTLKNYALADSNVFHLFNFNFIAGDAKTAFNQPNALILTESTARRLFGDENPMGKGVMVSNRREHVVTAVVEDVQKMHLEINAFGSIQDVARRPGNENWLTARSYNFPIYLLLAPGVNVNDLVGKINQRAVEVDQWSGDPLVLRPFNAIYFERNCQHENNTKHGNMNLVVVFSIIAVFILGIACINFVNLTIAKTGTREKEIALRKVVGAGRGSIQKQFFGEMFIIVFTAFLLAMLLIHLYLADFNRLTGELIQLSSLTPRLMLIIAGVLLMTALVSGAYPSFYLSVLKPVAILKGSSGKGRKNSLLSNLLIGFQFTISIFLIITTLTVVKQLRYMQTKDLGMNHDQVLVTTLRGDRFRGESETYLGSKRAFKNRLLQNSAIQGVTYMSQLPGEIKNTWSWYVTDEENRIPVKVITGDPDFLDLFGLELLDGRNLSFEREQDLQNRFLINETLAKTFQLEKTSDIALNGGNVHVVGMVKDFHFNSLHNQIEPMAIRYSWWTRNACIKIAGSNIPGAIRYIETLFYEFCPGFSFEYDFMDQTFARQYRAEQRLENLLTIFVGLAIGLSCLGLFALTAFVARRRTREIGIRKVLGSTNRGIVVLLARHFTTWILLANLVAWPLAFYLLRNWLQSFAYHIAIDPALFVGGGAGALFLAWLTITFQALKAASANPVDSLRCDG